MREQDCCSEVPAGPTRVSEVSDLVVQNSTGAGIVMVKEVSLVVTGRSVEMAPTEFLSTNSTLG